METKSVEYWSRKELEALPYRDGWNKDVICSSIVFLPTRSKHDSGFRCMDFVAVDENWIPACRLSGCSDVLYIDGIGGYGEWDKILPRMVGIKGWSIDCLPKSGLLRLFPGTNFRIRCKAALSSFEIYGVKRTDVVGTV